MVNYNYEDVELSDIDESQISSWISNILSSEKKVEGEINYIFCTDDFLLDINKKFLNHDTYTDIISFDYTVGEIISGDIFISLDRVAENAEKYSVSFKEELYRVMAHGILHYCGYKDKTKQDQSIMRSKEDYYLSSIEF